jgi:hypothetical protein
LRDINEISIFSTVITKILKCQIHENPSHGRTVVPCGRTNRQKDDHGEANSRFSKFGEHTQTRKITSENEKVIMKIEFEEENCGENRRTSIPFVCQPQLSTALDI